MVPKAMAPVVQFRAAVALAGRFPALAGVDLSLHTGEVVLVVGANGAGKTSLLRACAGLLPVTSGEAWILGVDLTADHTAVRRHVGLLGHAAPLYDELTAAENVRFAVRALGLPASGAGWPWRRWWPAARPYGCSMSRTPGSMPSRAPSSETSSAKPSPTAPPCCSRPTSPSWPSPCPIGS
jgi:hypothetical protein